MGEELVCEMPRCRTLLVIVHWACISGPLFLCFFFFFSFSLSRKNKNKKTFLNFLCVTGYLPECLWTMWLHCPQKPEEGIGLSITRLTGGCYLPCWCWDSNPVPQEEHSPLFLFKSLLSILLFSSSFPHYLSSSVFPAHIFPLFTTFPWPHSNPTCFCGSM